MSNFLRNLAQKFKVSNSLIRLIFINIAIFVVVRTCFAVVHLFNIDGGNFFVYAEMPAAWHNFVRQPWSILTYMFLHYKLWHLVFNMLCLYWFGKLFLMQLSVKQLVGVYILGGIAGGIVYSLAYTWLPAFASQVHTSYLLGASASVIAIMVAAAKMLPNYPVRLLLVGEVKLKYIAIFTVVLSFFGINSSNAGGEFSHLGGALLGYIFAVLYAKNFDLTQPITAIFTWFAKIFKPKPKKRKMQFKNRPKTDAEYNYEKKQNEKNIDKILDKIKKSGYASLTADEKKQLFEQSHK